MSDLVDERDRRESTVHGDWGPVCPVCDASDCMRGHDLMETPRNRPTTNYLDEDSALVGEVAKEFSRLGCASDCSVCESYWAVDAEEFIDD